MSETTTEFNSTPFIVGARPTTYGELRQHARDTIANTTVDTIDLAVAFDRELTPGAIKGLARVVLALLDEIERLTPEQAA